MLVSKCMLLTIQGIYQNYVFRIWFCSIGVFFFIQGKMRDVTLKLQLAWSCNILSRTQGRSQASLGSLRSGIDYSLCDIYLYSKAMFPFPSLKVFSVGQLRVCQQAALGSLLLFVEKKDYSLKVGKGYAYLRVMFVYSISQSIWHISRKSIYILGLPMLTSMCILLNIQGKCQDMY